MLGYIGVGHVLLRPGLWWVGWSEAVIQGIEFRLFFPVAAEDGGEEVFEFFAGAGELLEQGGEFDIVAWRQGEALAL